MDSLLQEELARFGLSLPQDRLQRLEKYVQELQRWNRTVNLTALKGVDLVRRLVVEPAWIGLKLQMSGTLWDVGSGNGCPGIPLFVTCNLKRLDLVEARARRAAFLRHIASEIGLNNVFVHRVRLEDIENPPEEVDWISLQAVDPSRKLIQVLRSLFSSTTRVVWITSRPETPQRGTSLTSVPGSNTVAQVFRLDQF